MGRNAAHTKEQVFSAADALAANGQEVTPNALRDVLGRGSYSTFVKHIEAWQQERQAAPVPVVLEMPDSVKAAFAQCWQAAATEAGKEIAAIREKADAEIKTIKRRLDDAIGAIEQLETESEADAARLETATTELATERTNAQRATTEAAARESALSATAEQMGQQIEAQQSELDRVHTEAEAERSRHVADVARLTADFNRQLSDQAAALLANKGEIDRLRDQLAAVEKNLETTATREREKIEEAAKAKADASRLADQLKDQKTRSAEVIGKLEKDKQQLAGELATVQKDLRAQSAQLGKATGALESLRTQVAGQNEVIKEFATSKKNSK